MIFYHYCSNFAFHSIILQKRIRLSLLSLSNDSKEGQHIIAVAQRLLQDDFTHKNDILDQLRKVISLISAIGFCVSADEDVLSQWRGYADNAQGVAIGFDHDALKVATEQETNDSLIIRFTPVVYEDDILAEVMVPDLQPVIDHYKSGKLARPRRPLILVPMTEEEQEQEKQRYQKSSNELFRMLLRIANYAYMVKAPFFSEEKEWRIVALLTNAGSALVLPEPQFHPGHEKLTPFRDFPLKGFSPSMIKEIVLGPRNQTPDEVARLFLNSQGFGHVSIRRSTGSYR